MIRRFQTLVNLRKRLRWEGNEAGESLIALLKDTSSNGFTKPQDRIYSLLGLARAEDRLSITIDYDRSVCEVFSEVVQHHISKTRNLDIFFDGWSCGGEATAARAVEVTTTGVKSSQDRPSDLPTWMPNFLQPFGSKPPWLRFASFTCSGESTPSFITRSRSLYLNAMVCGKIHACTRLQLVLGEANEANHLFRHPEELRPRAVSGELKLSWHLQRLSGFEELLDLPRNDSTCQCFVTTAGLVGLAEFPLQPDDIVVLPFGSTVPCILRCLKGARFSHPVYILLGACYVSGIMNGEMMRFHEITTRSYHIQ